MAAMSILLRGNLKSNRKRLGGSRDSVYESEYDRWAKYGSMSFIRRPKAQLILIDKIQKAKNVCFSSTGSSLTSQDSALSPSSTQSSRSSFLSLVFKIDRTMMNDDCNFGQQFAQPICGQSEMEWFLFSVFMATIKYWVSFCLAPFSSRFASLRSDQYWADTKVHKGSIGWHDMFALNKSQWTSPQYIIIITIIDNPTLLSHHHYSRHDRETF